MRYTATLLSLLALFAFGCGDDGGGGGGKNYDEPLQTGPTETQAATSSVDSVSDMRTLATDSPGDDQAVGQATGIWGNLNLLVSKKQQAELQSGPGGAPQGTAGFGLTAGALETVTAALDEACYTESEGSVTYDQCDYGAGTIDGSVSYVGEKLSIDLQITSLAGGNWIIDETGELTVSDALIDGTLNLSIDSNVTEGQAAGFSFSYDVDAIYAVQLTDGCPTGGTLEVHAVSSVEGADIPQGAGGAYDVWVKAEFGPSCGDVTLY